MEEVPFYSQLTQGSGVTPSERVTSGHLSQAADNPLHGNSLYISCGPTPTNVVTSDLCNPRNVNSDTPFTIRNTEQRKAGNHVNYACDPILERSG